MWFRRFFQLIVFACGCTSALAVSAQAASTPSADLSEHVEIRPARLALQLAPGETTTVQITVANTTDQPVLLTFRTIDLVAGDSESFAKPSTKLLQRTAVPWIQVPRGESELQPGASKRVPVGIRVSENASPGAYAVAIVASQTFATIGADTASGSAPRVQVNADLGSTLVIVVPGDAVSDARIESHTSPRIVWGSDVPTFSARVRNTGNTLLKLEAATELSAFGTFASRTIKSREAPTLPDGERQLTMRWTDRPWIGWFTPTLVVVGGTGSDVRVTQKLSTVIVIPPWWMLALMATLIAWPVWWHRRSRRRMKTEQERRGAQRHARRDEWDDD